MIERLDRLDHLRALAAFLVVAWHLSTTWGHHIPNGLRFLSFIKQGHTGVSIFCVISGFILTTIYVKRETTYATFITSRFLRVAPLFVFIVFLSFFASDWSASDLLISTLTGLVRGGLQSFAGPGWTVLIEMQFYLMFPFLLIFTRRYGARYVVGLLLTFLLVRAATWIATGTVQQIAYYSIFGRMDQFLIGMIAAIILTNERTRKLLKSRNVAAAILAAGVIATIAFYWWFESKGGLLAFKGQPWPNRSALWIFMPSIEGILFATIMLGYLHLPKISRFNLTSKAIAYVGLISYSIYLNHILVFPSIIGTINSLGLAPSSWAQGLLLCVFVAMPILIAVSSMTYFFIERPFMQIRRTTSETPSSPVWDKLSGTQARPIARNDLASCHINEKAGVE